MRKNMVAWSCEESSKWVGVDGCKSTHTIQSPIISPTPPRQWQNMFFFCNTILLVVRRGCNECNKTSTLHCIWHPFETLRRHIAVCSAPLSFYLFGAPYIFLLFKKHYRYVLRVVTDSFQTIIIHSVHKQLIFIVLARVKSWSLLCWPTLINIDISIIIINLLCLPILTSLEWVSKWVSRDDRIESIDKRIPYQQIER